MGYAAAIGSGVSIIVLTRTLLANILKSMKGNKLIYLETMLIVLAGGVANACNAGIMRIKEFRNGIPITNEKGDVQYGISVKAGRKAVLETAFTRACMPIMSLGTPIGLMVLI